MANGKRVQFARGTREQEDAVTGLEGEMRVDTTRKELRLHDGVTQGGVRIPSIDYIESRLTGGGGAEGASTGKIQFFATEAELKAVVPDPALLAVLTEAGKEDEFFWRSGAAQPGDIASDVNGHWERIDGEASLVIQFWRAGMINLQIDGTQPVANQGITPWLLNGAIKLWDGAAYVDGTPATWMRLFATVGGYTTVGFTLPDRLQATMVDAANLDTLVDSGWYRSTTGATGNPTPAVNAVHHDQLSAQVAIQRVYPPADSTRGHYIRVRTSSGPNVWSGWTYVNGELPNRLAANQTEINDVNNAIESGFYRIAAGAANSPTVGTATVVTTRTDGNNLTQIMVTISEAMLFRRRNAGTWGGWKTVSLDGHAHDDRYYTKAQDDSLLAGKSSTSHLHDDRYYTESEVNTLLSGKQNLLSSGYPVGSYYILTIPAQSGQTGINSAASQIGLPGTWAARGGHNVGGTSSGYDVLLCQRIS